MKRGLFRLSSLFLLAFTAILVLAGTWTNNEFLYKPDIGARGEREKGNYDSGLNRLDARLGKEIWVGDPKYGSTLQAAITAIGSNNVILRLPAGTHAIAADLAIPANVTLKVERGATLAVATTKTLTINGTLEAGPYQIFSCTGTGKVKGAATVSCVYPQWWGAVGDGVQDDTAAFQAAMDFWSNTYHDAYPMAVKVPVPSVKYLITDSLYPKSGSVIEGVTQLATNQANNPFIYFTPASAKYLFVMGDGSTYGCSYATLRNFRVKANANALGIVWSRYGVAEHCNSSNNIYENINCGTGDFTHANAILFDIEQFSYRNVIKNCNLKGASSTQVSTQTGIRIGTSSQHTRIKDCWLQYLGKGVETIGATNSNLTLDNVMFAGLDYGVYLHKDYEAVKLDTCSFEAIKYSDVYQATGAAPARSSLVSLNCLHSYSGSVVAPYVAAYRLYGSGNTIIGPNVNGNFDDAAIPFVKIESGSTGNVLIGGRLYRSSGSQTTDLVQDSGTGTKRSNFLQQYNTGRVVIPMGGANLISNTTIPAGYYMTMKMPKAGGDSEAAFHGIVLPSDFAGTHVHVCFSYYMGGAGSGNVYMSWGLSQPIEGEDKNTGDGTSEVFAAPAATDIMGKFTSRVITARPGSFIRIDLKRRSSHANDTATGDVYITAVWLEYDAN